MEAQGYNIKQNILFQDNQSEIKMKNGKKLCNGNSSHTNIHYLFAKDQVELSNMSIAYCITEHMLVDFLQSPYKDPCLQIFAKLSWDGSRYITYK